MKKKVDIFLTHINESINQIEDYMRGVSEKKFIADRKLQDAVIRRLEIIGEATKNLTIDFVDKYPKIDWRSFAGLRDKLIHHYFGVNLKRIWKIIKDELPQLKKYLKEIQELKNE